MAYGFDGTKKKGEREREDLYCTMHLSLSLMALRCRLCSNEHKIPSTYVPGYCTFVSCLYLPSLRLQNLGYLIPEEYRYLPSPRESKLGVELPVARMILLHKHTC